MDKKYVIMCRYEHWSNEGKVWTKWFVKNSTPYSKEEVQSIIKEINDNFAFIDKKTHLKHEYNIKDYDEYVKEQENLIKHTKELAKATEEYKKSDEYKELQKKKRQSTKERKERQKKYLEEHKISKS